MSKRTGDVTEPLYTVLPEEELIQGRRHAKYGERAPANSGNVPFGGLNVAERRFEEETPLKPVGLVTPGSSP